MLKQPINFYSDRMMELYRRKEKYCYNKLEPMIKARVEGMVFL